MSHRIQQSYFGGQLCSIASVEFHPWKPLILAIQDLCHCIGNVEFVHNFREANAYANVLANQGHALQPGLHSFFSLPSYISIAFHADSVGTTFSRLVAM